MSEIDEHVILAESERVLADDRFANSPSLIRFLNYTLTETLAGRSDQLKEILLGREVFDRGDQFDPRIDPIVRVQAGKLRAKLQDYYEHEGASDPIRIEFPKGSYIPRFSPRRAIPIELPPPDEVPARRVRPGGRSRQWVRIGIAVAALAAVALALAAWNRSRERGAAAQPVTLTQLTFEAGSAMMPAMSRDGKLLAYSSDSGIGDLNIWIRPVGGGAPVQLTHHEAADHSPDFSPDNNSIVFRSYRQEGGLYLVPVFGGEEKRIADEGWLPRFSPDGAWIAYLGSEHSIFVIPSTGGPPRKVAAGGFEAHSGPIWTPEGKHILFIGAPRSAPGEMREYDWYVVPWTGGSPVQTGLRRQLRSQGLPEPGPETRPGDWLGDSVVFSLRNGKAANIWKVPLDVKNFRVTGRAVQLTAGSATESFPRTAAGGRIVFTSEDQLTHLYSLGLNPKTGEAIGEPRQVTSDSSLHHGTTVPRLSADGRTLAFVSNRSGSREVLVKDLEDGKETALTAVARDESLPLSTGDASLLIYGSDELGGESVYAVEPGKPFANKVCDRCGTVEDWSRDGRVVLFEAPSRSSLIVWDRDSGKRFEWLKYPVGSLSRAALSEDKHWVAVVLTSPVGAFIAHITDQPISPDQMIPVGADRDLGPARWSPDGTLLYFFARLDDYRCLWARRLDPATKHPLGAPFAVQHFHSNRLGPWGTSISVGNGRMVFPLTEPRSNIWLATPAGPQTGAANAALR